MNRRNDYPIDFFLTSDEWWSGMRLIIRNNIESYESNPSCTGDAPFIQWFEEMLHKRLREEGFRKEILDNQSELKKLTSVLDSQGFRYKDWNWIESPPYGLPTESYTVSEDGHTMWVRPSMEAALRSLESLMAIKKLLVNKNAVQVFLLSLDLIVNSARAGRVPDLARTEAKKNKGSLETRELKKTIIQEAILRIFDKNPHRPRTVGEVWNKINSIEEITVRQTGMKYQVRTVKNKAGEDIVLITGRKLKKPLSYKKRTLERYIRDLK